MILIIISLGAAATGLWYERERLLSEVHRVSGEVSNLHARLDSGDTDTQDAIAFVQAQMTTLFQEQEQLAVAVTRTREELYGLLTSNEELVNGEALSSIAERIGQLEEQAALRDQQLTAIRSSLNALEQAGVSGRQNLAEEVTYLEDMLSQRLSATTSRLDDMAKLENENSELVTNVTEWQEEVDQRFTEVNSTLEMLSSTGTSATQEALQALEQQWAQRLNTLESDIRQVRQAQLAFSAQMEMLR
jgi:predicted  nucleic acid-binding Zn-ribbon protein